MLNLLLQHFCVLFAINRKFHYNCTDVVITYKYGFMSSSDFLLSVLSGVIGSIFVLLLLFTFMKPSIAISTKIAHIDNARFGEILKNSYLFKIVNNSIFIAYDIRVELEKIEKYSVKNGSNNRILPLILSKNNVYFVKNKNIWNRNNGQNAYLFKTNEDLSKILEENCSVRFMIPARHGFSGLTKIFIQEFDVISDIEVGHFCKGKKFDINP